MDDKKTNQNQGSNQTFSSSAKSDSKGNHLNELSTPPANQELNSVITPDLDIPPLPPDFQSLQTEQNSTPNSESTKITENSSLENSFSPPPSVSIPQKKFGGNRIIATILGILLLVGGVGAGILLTQQQQLFEQKAAIQSCKDITKASECQQTCSPPKSTDNKSYQCKWLSSQSKCVESANECNNDGSCNTYSDGKNCGSDGFSCVGAEPEKPGCSFCLSKNCNRTCNQVLLSNNCKVKIADQDCSSITNPKIFYCEGDFDISQKGCFDNDPLPPGVRWDPSTHSIKGSFCGTIQVDQNADEGSSAYCSWMDRSGCGTNPTPTPTTKPTPTPTPPVNASCLSVTAYDANWQAIDVNKLSSLKVGTKVNFCVAGSSNSGAFDKAQFKINTTLYPETITKRPSSNDYCQSYTITSTDKTVDIKAKIHHTILGWIGEQI